MKHFKNKLIALFSLLSLSCCILAAELGGEHSTLICPQSLNIPEKTFIESDLTDDDIYNDDTGTTKCITIYTMII